MEKPTHFVEARILPLDGDLLSRGDMAFVTSRIMSAVHLAVVSGLKLAVSFPEFQEKLDRDAETKEIKLAGTGSIVRFFGSMNDLMSFIVRPDFACLIGEAACRINGAMPIREVPTLVAWEIYYRNRAIERGFDGFINREGRRLERLGLTIDKVKNRRLHDVADRSHFAHFNMTSSSTGQKYSVFLSRKDVIEYTPGALTTHGLGVSVPVF